MVEKGSAMRRYPEKAQEAIRAFFSKRRELSEALTFFGYDATSYTFDMLVEDGTLKEEYEIWEMLGGGESVLLKYYILTEADDEQ